MRSRSSHSPHALPGRIRGLPPLEPIGRLDPRRSSSSTARFQSSRPGPAGASAEPVRQQQAKLPGRPWAAVISQIAETVAVWLWLERGVETQRVLAAGLQTRPQTKQRTPSAKREPGRGIRSPGQRRPALVRLPIGRPCSKQPAQHHRAPARARFHRPIGPCCQERPAPPPSFLPGGALDGRLKRRRFFNHQLQRNLQAAGRVAKGEQRRSRAAPTIQAAPPR